jgi:ectoine hydroxylase-related dioxygenase (phytanoyl-CoA dioxygenase family)
MSTENIKSTYEKDGVILLENCVPQEMMASVREQYDEVDKQLVRTDIPADKPIIVFWKHVAGETKRIAFFEEFPALWKLITDVIVPTLRINFPGRLSRLQLLETIIFNKPALISNTLNWHQDVSYFPLSPNNQIAVWLPFEMVTRERGAMAYALGSHKGGIRGSTNLHTREPFVNEDRPLIPSDPTDEGYDVKIFEMTPRDMLVHDGYTWHYSGPNHIEGYTRRGLSVRFIIEESRFDPRPGQGAAFTKQIKVAPGEIVDGLAFPLL